MSPEALPIAELVALAQRALMLSVLLALPVLLAAAVAGLVSAVFQAATQVHDPALGHLPKFVAVVSALIVTAPWMGQHVLAFALHVLGGR